MRKIKLIVAIIIAVLIFTIGILFADAVFNELNILENKFKDCIPEDVFIKKQNEYIQLILNFLMFAIGEYKCADLKPSYSLSVIL